ncbi:tripartite tricarboxylate transporter permease [Hoeflea sp. WL0058]|uniref:Tripartite tricarboxylate transporter permease n=1 Tax=Flavimaribacter sediminis TaxID=2865987 RepID=A0AAE2ZR02_9HYPH|nr:tripartite tricarboxylate transporter permease [Flavimaribacter sediminis]MBW8639180.1 tripartite tricarboxylate transporter permease [Flavimaribacter sediminis]
MFTELFASLAELLSSPLRLGIISGGIGLGIVVGAIPGLTATMGIALALPLTFGMPPELGVSLLIGIFVGAIHGGGVPGILVRTPGTPASSASMLDGYSLTEQGRASFALGVHATASASGTICAAIIMTFASQLLARGALQFGPAQFFLLGLVGLTVVASFAGQSAVRGMIAALLGLLLSTVGLDPITAASRFTFGSFELASGLNIIPVLIGLFALSQVFEDLLTKRTDESANDESRMSGFKVELPSFKLFRRLMPTLLKSGIIGTGIGAIPGPGAVLGGFIPYAEARRTSKEPEKFGKGSEEGLAAAEAGNNAAAIGALVPTLALGLPGEAATAVMLGGFMIHGLHPGPMLFQQSPEIVNSLYAAVLLAAPILFVLAVIFARYAFLIAYVRPAYLVPTIVLFSVIGSYAIRNSIFDVAVAVMFGVIGLIAQRNRYPIVPILLGLVLGPIIESNFRRALLISRGDPMIFVDSPVSIALIAIGVISLWMGLRLSRKNVD